MTADDINLANRAIRLVNQGTDRQRDELENECGESHSSILDNLWADAEDCGERALAKRLQAAFARLTG